MKYLHNTNVSPCKLLIIDKWKGVVEKIGEKNRQKANKTKCKQLMNSGKKRDYHC